LEAYNLNIFAKSIVQNPKIINCNIVFLFF